MYQTIKQRFRLAVVLLHWHKVVQSILLVVLVALLSANTAFAQKKTANIVAATSLLLTDDEDATGNFRVVNVTVSNLLAPRGLVSENILTWNATGRIATELINTYNAALATNPIVTINSSYAYDAQQRRRTVSADIVDNLNSGQSSSIANYSYSANGRVSLVETVNQSSGQTSTVQLVFVYNVAGQMSEVTETVNSNGVQTVTQHRFNYDAAGRVMTNHFLSNGVGGSTSGSHTYRYDSVGNLTQAVTLDGTTRLVKTFSPISGNKQVTRWRLSLLSTGELIGDSEVVGTYTAGRCVLAAATDAESLQGAITGQAYSPNIGCIQR